jgi:hypothetical protein
MAELEGSDGRRYAVGGNIQNVVWSPNNDRLVIQFAGEEEGYTLLFFPRTFVSLFCLLCSFFFFSFFFFLTL